MYCSNCGSQLKETDIFCSKCGHKQGNDNKLKEPPKEEVVFNTSSQKERANLFVEQENQSNNNVRNSEERFRAPKQSHQSVSNARRPAEDDFVWNVHQFPEPGPREVEDVDFHWDEKVQTQGARTMRPSASVRQNDEFVDESKFHTYNKSREEFQELLDREYLRQERDPEYPADRNPREYPADRNSQEYLAFNPIDHMKEAEKQREEVAGYYVDGNGYDQDSRKFDTLELQKDLGQPEMDETSRTQVIEKINYGDETYRNQDDDFDIKKTQFIQDEERKIVSAASANAASTFNAPSIPPMGSKAINKDSSGVDVENSVLVSNKDEIIVQKEEAVITNMEQPKEVIYENPLNIAGNNDSEVNLGKVSEEEIRDSLDKTEYQKINESSSSDVDQQLSKLWDSDTAPVPVASLASKLKAEEKIIAEDKTELNEPLDDIYGEYDVKNEKKGGFLGKFIIAIIVIILIIEGSILGLRNFAPESEVTVKANQVILTIQNWVEDTFFDKK